MKRLNDDQAIYVISVAAELAGVHPQTLRVYERKGLVRPKRTAGNTRRYSQEDIERLRKIQELTNEGINLAGVVRIIKLEEQLEQLRARHAQALQQLREAEEDLRAVMEGRSDLALVPLKDIRRIRRALKADVLDRHAARRVFAVPPVQNE